MKELILHTELRFWEAIIPIMKQSTIFQRILKFLYPFFEGLKIKQVLKTISITCISGFVLGWLAFYTYYLTQ